MDITERERRQVAGWKNHEVRFILGDGSAPADLSEIKETQHTVQELLGRLEHAFTQNGPHKVQEHFNSLFLSQ